MGALTNRSTKLGENPWFRSVRIEHFRLKLPEFRAVNRLRSRLATHLTLQVNCGVNAP
jgi:hypothetical protein